MNMKIKGCLLTYWMHTYPVCATQVDHAPVTVMALKAPPKT